MSKEKRKHRRLPTTIIADIYDGDSFEIKGKGCIINLSKTGIAIETNVKLEKKKPFFMRLNVPMEVLCEIVRIDEKDNLFNYGIKFSKIKFSDTMKFKKVIFED
ncbi:MAG: PilZ domain-containing protein [Elusimicrobia bacterium]|nr:PilZ domain-containing protein [Elusimicrobiota bacterium]